MDSQLKDQLQQDILVANSTGVNSYGELQYAAAVTYEGRVVGKQEYIKGPDGESLFSSKQIVLSATADIRVNSRVYLPGETTSGNDGWVPVGLALRVNETGSSDYWKVWLGGAIV